MKKPLSPRQQEVYALILAAHRDRRPAPTYREIGDALGISSTNAVADHVEALVKKGWVSRGPVGQARTLVPVVKKAAGLAGRVRVLEARVEALQAELGEYKELAALNVAWNSGASAQSGGAAREAVTEVYNEQDQPDLFREWLRGFDADAYAPGGREHRALTEERDRLKDRVQVERDDVERLRTMLSAATKGALP